MRLKEAMAASGSPNPYISKGGMLLDDMGLGKTLQLIALCMCGSMQKPTLVVCPASIVNQWCSEIAKHATGHFWSRAIYRRSGRQTMACLKSSAFVVCSYEQVIARGSGRNMLHDVSFGRMILDEGMFVVAFRFEQKLTLQFFFLAHRIRNLASQTYKAVSQIKRDMTWCVTGTELHNGIEDVGAYVTLLGIPAVPDLEAFMNIVMNGSKVCLEQVAKLYNSLCMRRMKDDPELGLLNLLPAKEQIEIELQLSPIEQASYDAILQPTLMLMPRAGEEISKRQRKSLLTEITRLRQTCCSSMLVSDPKLAISRPTHSTKTRAIVRQG